MEPLEIVGAFPGVFIAFPQRMWDGSTGWNVKCPCSTNHRRDDRRWSGRIWHQDDRLRWWCGKGCRWDEVVSATGTSKRDWFKGDRKMDQRENVKIVSEYPYYDYDGTLLFQVCRTNPKGFFQRRPGPGGKGWCYNLLDCWVVWDGGTSRWANAKPNWPGAIHLPPVKKVLYNQNEITKRKEQPVLIVEGEKTSNALTTLGYLSACSPGGAGKWKTGYGGILSGRDVVIFPDNDEPGLEHATQVAASALLYEANSIRIVRPGMSGYVLAEGGDVFDWLMQQGVPEMGTMKLNHTRYEAIKALVRRTKKFTWQPVVDARLPVR